MPPTTTTPQPHPTPYLPRKKWIRSTYCSSPACLDVPGSNATGYNSDNVDITTQAFDNTKSTTEKPMETLPNQPEYAPVHTIRYGTGQVAVALFKENVQFMTSGRRTVAVTEQDVGLSVRQSTYPFASLGFDGIVGLGYPVLALNHSETLMNNMKRQGIIDRRIWSYRIGMKEDDGSGAAVDGTVGVPSLSAIAGQSSLPSLASLPSPSLAPPVQPLANTTTTTTYTVIEKPDGSVVYAPASGSRGEITVGGWRPDHFQGPLQWAPLSKAMYWQVSLVGLRYGDVDILNTNATAAQGATADGATSATPTTNGGDSSLLSSLFGGTPAAVITQAQPAVMDTGTTLIILPKPIGKRLSKLMRGWRISLLHNVLVKCSRIDQLKPITFTFLADNRDDAGAVKSADGATPSTTSTTTATTTTTTTHFSLTLQPDQYVFGKKSGDGIPLVDRCFTHFDVDDLSPHGDGNVAVLGEGFLRNFYSVWDEENERMGFGQLPTNQQVIESVL